MGKTTQKPLVSIIIPHYGESSILLRCLQSIAQNTHRDDWEVIIVNSGTALDSDVHSVINRILHAVIITTANNGYAASINRGIKASVGVYFVIMNNDVEVESGWLTPLIEATESATDIAGAQGKVLSLRDKKTFDYAGGAGGYIDIFGYPFCRGRVFSSLEKDIGQYDNVQEIFWTCGVCMCISRRAFEKVGLFDEIFFMYGEEIDWCWRARMHGMKFLFSPESVIYHAGSANTKQWKSQKKIYYLHRNHMLMLIKNYSTSRLLLILPIKLAMEIVSISYYLVTTPTSALAVISAFCWNISHFHRLFIYRAMHQKQRLVSDNKIWKSMLCRSVAFDYFILKKTRFPQLNHKISHVPT